MYVFGSITSGLTLAYVVSSEQLDSWGDMSAIAILGALCVGFGVLHWKVISAMSQAHEQMGETIAEEIRKQNTAMNQLLNRLVSGSKIDDRTQ